MLLCRFSSWEPGCVSRQAARICFKMIGIQTTTVTNAVPVSCAVKVLRAGDQHALCHVRVTMGIEKDVMPHLSPRRFCRREGEEGRIQMFGPDCTSPSCRNGPPSGGICRLWAARWCSCRPGKPPGACPGTPTPAFRTTIGHLQICGKRHDAVFLLLLHFPSPFLPCSSHGLEPACRCHKQGPLTLLPVLQNVACVLGGVRCRVKLYNFKWTTLQPRWLQ